MLDLKFVTENPELVEEKIALRGIKLNLKNLLDLNKKRKDILKHLERKRAEVNKASKIIGQMKNEGKNPQQIIKEMKEISESIKTDEQNLKDIDSSIEKILLSIPNIPHQSVPVGTCSNDNLEIRKFGKIPEFSFTPKTHWDIGTGLGILDFERAAKLAGSRFAVYLGKGALLERALINFMLDVHTGEKGYKEIIPPFIANADCLVGTGNLPKFEEDLFQLQGYSWYLIPTGEVPLTNFYRNEILPPGSLPRRFVAYTPCFRSEAGSYGKDIRGLVRQHQFNKVELVIFSRPEESFQELEKLTSDAEDILKLLELPYRVVSLCTGDLGFAGAKTYDLEIWMPARKGYLEISSCTNCCDFQARRAGIRFRREDKAKPEFVHTLNGSGLAVGRTVAAILENYQQEDGTVIIPEVLRPYMNGCSLIS